MFWRDGRIFRQELDSGQARLVYGSDERPGGEMWVMENFLPEPEPGAPVRTARR